MRQLLVSDQLPQKVTYPKLESVNVRYLFAFWGSVREGSTVFYEHNKEYD